MIILHVALLMAITSLPPEVVNKSLAKVPKALATANALTQNIGSLQTRIGKPSVLKERAESAEERQLRDERRNLTSALTKETMPLLKALEEARDSIANATDYPPYYDQLREPIAKLSKFRSMIQDLEHVFQEEYEARTLREREREAAPVDDPRSLEARKVTVVKSHFDAFLHADPTRFVFSRLTFRQDRGNNALKREVQKGEALLVRDISSSSVYLITVDGMTVELYEDDVSTRPMASTSPHRLKSEWLTIEDEKGYVGGPNDLEDDDTGFGLDGATFLRALSPDDPRIERFVDQRDKITGCYRAMMEKLDPDNRRADFDLVHYGADGVRKKVESLESVYDRKACAKCGCKKFNDSKRKLVRAALQPLQKAQYAELKPAIDRVNALFKR